MNRFAWLLLVMVLSGCVLQRPEPVATTPGAAVQWDARRDRLLALQSWQARGRIAARSDTGGGQGAMDWRQSRSSSHIELRGPFGAGAFEIDLEPDSLTVTDRHGAVTAAFSGPDAAEQFLQARLGWSFPARSTRYWMLGLLDPGYAGEELFDATGSLVGLEQNGWTLSYDGFARYGDYWMPRKLVMQTDKARVRVIIDEWMLH